MQCLFFSGDDDESIAVMDFDERDIENVNFNNRSRSGSARKRRDSYDYMNTVQMLGKCSCTLKPSDNVN